MIQNVKGLIGSYSNKVADLNSFFLNVFSIDNIYANDYYKYSNIYVDIPYSVPSILCLLFYLTKP